MEGGPPSFTPDSSDSGVTQELHGHRSVSFTYRAFTVYGTPFQGTSVAVTNDHLWVLQPRWPKGQAV